MAISGRDDGVKPQPDANMALRWVDMLFRDCPQGWIRFGLHPSRNRLLPQWFCWPDRDAVWQWLNVELRNPQWEMVSLIPALFKSAENAKRENLALAPYVVLDADKTPIASGAMLAQFGLGAPTFEVASGGITAGGYAKWHKYFGVTDPTDFVGNRALREYLIAQIGTDGATKSLVLPARLPGSVHRRSGRLCVLTSSTDMRLDVSPWASLAGPSSGGSQAVIGQWKDEVPTPGDQLQWCAERMPIAKDRDEWVKYGHAFYSASHGADEGLAAFTYWSNRNHAYAPDDVGCEIFWNRITSPPRSHVGALWNACGHHGPPPEFALTATAVLPPGASATREGVMTVAQPPGAVGKRRREPIACGANGDKLVPNVANVDYALENDGTLREAFRLDMMTWTVMLWHPLPDSDAPHDGWKARALTDADVIAVQSYLQHTPGFERLGKSTVHDAIEVRAEALKYHPVRSYLDGVKWDGVPRVETCLHRYWGTPDTPYERAVGRCWIISAVARVYQPGCKVDTVLVFEGRQGKNKSRALRALAGGYFTDDVPKITAGSQQIGESLQGKWIVELPEFDALTKVGPTRAKAFVSRQVDRYRPPYGRLALDAPRQCVFAASTNEDEYLDDPTGDRRFWPLKTTRVDVEAIERDRDQLWAEAVHLYRAGSRWWLNDEQEALAKIEVGHRQVLTPEDEAIGAWADTHPDVKLVTVASVADAVFGWKLGMHGLTTRHRQIIDALRKLGFERRRTGKLARYYERK